MEQETREVFTFYTPQLNVSFMIETIKEELGNDILFFHEESNSIEITLKNQHFIKVFYTTLHEEGKLMEKQIDRLYRSIERIETDQQAIKRNLLYQITLFQAAYIFEFNYEKKQRNDAIIPLMEIADKTSSLIFWERGDISDSYGDIIFSKDGFSEVDTFYPLEEFPIANYSLGLDEEQLKRVRKSMKILRYKDIYVPNSIPTVSKERWTLFRSEEEIAKRCIALCVSALYADCILNQKWDNAKAYAYVEAMISLFHVQAYFSNQEIEFLNQLHPQEDECMFHYQHFEACFVLLWALGYADKLYYPSNRCDVSFIVRQIFSYDSLEHMVEQASMRSHSDILDAVDLVYKYEWACKDALKRGFEIPGDLDPLVVEERHRALNWIINYGAVSWDDVSIELN